MKRLTQMRATVVILIISLLVLCLPPAPSPLLAQAESNQSGVAQTGAGTIHLPLVAAPPGPPTFRIIAPADGAQISGTSFFAVQVFEEESVDTVSFQAGAIELGTDTSAGDGFHIFLDASEFAAGALQLTATATGPSGVVTESIGVTVVPAPPSSATVGTGGAILATASGHTIAVPPGAVSGEATISIQEKTQEQVTSDEGIDWDSLGVTFLGAIDVQSSVLLTKPLGVSSVGFGNRIQPGQAVVTYRILPDADGDGVSELVVINGANLAPNGTIVSSPVPEVSVNSISCKTGNAIISATDTNSGPFSPTQDDLHGPPGAMITIEASGLNPMAVHGNVTTFRSLVNGETTTIPALVEQNGLDPSQQLAHVLIPILPPGAAVLTIRNESTGATAGPFNLIVDTPIPLSQPAGDLVDSFIDQSLDFFAAVPTETEAQLGGLAAVNEQLIQLQSAMTTLRNDPSTEAQELLTMLATVVEGSGVMSDFEQVNAASRSQSGPCLTPYEKGIFVAAGGVVGAFAGLFCGIAGLFWVPAGVVCAGIVTLEVAVYTLIIALIPTCPPPPPPPPPTCPPTATNMAPGTTGMGSAPPPGGTGCGSAGGSPPNSVRSASTSLFEPGRFIVKIYPVAGGRMLSPFTGATDPGGYFYIPLIPQGEPFRALATDQVTGASVTVDGVGPATGESTLMYFDFSSAQQNRFEIAIGDTVTNGVPISGAGNIEIPHGLDIYAFNAEAGQRIFVDAMDLNLNVRWELLDPDGDSVFDSCIACGDPGVFTLAKAGIYTIRVGDDSSEEVGTYQFKLWDVPPSQQFEIAVGDTITNGIPGLGAGNIETPGVLDIYTFNAAAGQRLFFDVLELGVNIQWKLLGPDGTSIFSECLACGDPGAFTLANAGTYTITVGDNNNDDVGVYQFKLWNVPTSQEFAINIGDTVADASPAAGAGNIETPGVFDIYIFSASAGQRVFFDTLDLDVNIRWQLLDPGGVSIFGSCLACGDPGAFTLAQAGTYTIQVGDNDDDGIGTYQFKLWNVPASQEFAIAIGDTISNGVPGPGAGNIETPGVLDLYTFSAAAGQHVVFDVLNPGVNIRWQLLNPGGDSIFSRCLACGDPGEFTLAGAGTYTISVGDNNDDNTGVYSFQIRVP